MPEARAERIECLVMRLAELLGKRARRIRIEIELE